MKNKLIKFFTPGSLVLAEEFCKMLIPFVILLVSLITLYGWITKQEIYTKWLDSGESMKIFTAVSFILSSIILIRSSELQHKKNKFCDIIVSICSNWLLFIVGGLSIFSFFDFPSNLENIVAPQLPSLFALVGIFLIALSGLIICFNTDKKYKRLQFIGSLIYSLGMCGFIGYLFDLPYLYGHFNKSFHGMAFHTCLLFILYAIGLRLNCYPKSIEAKAKEIIIK